jgi:hypothetical protein
MAARKETETISFSRIKQARRNALNSKTFSEMREFIRLDAGQVGAGILRCTSKKTAERRVCGVWRRAPRRG